MMAINLETVEQDIRRFDTDIQRVETAVQRVETDIQRVEQKIQDVEALLEAAAREDVGYLREREQRLWGREKQLRVDKKQLRVEKKQLRRGKELLLMRQLDTSDAAVDRSEEWIKHMLYEQPPELPQNPCDLGKVLFPENHGKLPVQQLTYRLFGKQYSVRTEEFLIRADGSEVCAQLSQYLLEAVGPALSEMDVSIYVASHAVRLFDLLNKYSSTVFPYSFLFNKSEKKSGSLSGSTKRRSRPDTLLVANNTTLLVGEDRLDTMPEAERDLSDKVMELSTMFYGPVQFLLGYVAAGREFQWVYLGKDGKELELINPRLNLQDFSGRCRFLLSIGYAYQLLQKMATSVPNVPGGRAMFSTDVLGDRELFFLPGSVVKKIRNFKVFCALCETRLDMIKRAYTAAERCKFLPGVVEGPTESRTGTYSVKIRPLGYSVRLTSEQDGKMLARHVCKALSVLHEVGLVHRDVRLPNIVRVEKHFMLIDLETVAESPFILPEGFKYFTNWREEMLEGNLYTPMSDMYQLGRLLEQLPYLSTEGAKAFIKGLTSKQLSSQLALKDPWLSDMEVGECCGEVSEQRMVSRGLPNSTTPSSTPLPQHATVSEITTASLSGRLSTLVSTTKGAAVAVGKIEVLPPWLLAAKKQKEARMAANLIVLDDEDDPPILPSRSGLLGSTESQVPGSTGLDSRIAGELFGGTQENSSNEPPSALSEVSLASCRSKGVLNVAENNMILGSPMNAEMSHPSSRPINQSGGNFNPSATTQDSIRTGGNSTSTQQRRDLLQTATSSDYELSERERAKSLGTTGKVEQVEKTGKNVDPPVGSGGSVISFLPPSWMVGGNPGATRGAAAQACKAAGAFLSKSEAAPQVTQLETLGLIDGLVVSGVPRVTRCSSLPLQRFKPEEEASAVAKAATAIGDGENPLSHDAAQSMFLKHSMSLQRPRQFTSDLNENKQRCNGSKGTSLNNVEHEMKQVGTQVLQSHLGKQQQLNQDTVIPLNATESNVNQALTRSREESKAAGDCTSPNHSGKQSSLGQGRQHPVSINYTRKDVPDLMTMTPLGMQVARNAFYREKQLSSTTNLVDPPYTTPPISSTNQITLRNSEARCRADNECQAGAVGSMPDLVDDIILSQDLERSKEFVSPSRGLPVGVGLLDAVEPTVAVQNSVKAGACIHPPDLVRSLSAGGDTDVQIEHNCKSPPVKCVRGAITGNSVNLQVIVRKPLSDPVRERSPAADLKKILSSNSAQPSIGSASDVFVTEHTGCRTGSERRSADMAAAIESSAITAMGQADDKPQPGTRTNISEAAHLEHASRAVPSEGILNTGSVPSFPVGQANSYASLRQQSEGPDKLNLAGATAMNASDISTSSPSILDVRKMVKSHPFNVQKNVTAMKTRKGVGHWLLPPSAQPLVGSVFSLKFKFHERGASVTLYQERVYLKKVNVDPNGAGGRTFLFQFWYK